MPTHNQLISQTREETYSLCRLFKNKAEVINQVVIQIFILIHFFLLNFCLLGIDLTFCQSPLDFSLFVHDLDECLLVLMKTTC